MQQISKKQKTILITGGAGFIGSHVNKMLHSGGYTTIVLDNLSTGNRQAVTQGLFIEGDIGDLSLLDRLFTEHSIAAVMHFAASTDVGESVADPLKYYRNNVGATLNLLDAMRRHQVKNLIFSSSAAIFGIPQELSVSETHPCYPINPYGESKLIVERVLQDMDRANEIKFCCLRYFNAAGGDPEGQLKNYKRKETNLIPIILKSLQLQREVTIFGTDYPTPDGTCVRDYVHIEDLGAAHIMAMEQLLTGGPSTCYNLGNGQGFSVRQVIAAVQEVTGKSIRIIEGARREGDPPFLVANAQKAEKELGWQPRYPTLQAMIQHAWNAMG
jgi:UDP-glucose 4-epimerase